jgi:hypothetical protein
VARTDGFASLVNVDARSISCSTVSSNGVAAAKVWLTSDASDDTASRPGRAGTQLRGVDERGCGRFARAGDAGSIGPDSIDARAGPKDEWATLANGDLAWRPGRIGLSL